MDVPIFRRRTRLRLRARAEAPSSSLGVKRFSNDDMVRYKGRAPQAAASRRRRYCVKASVRVHEHPDRTLAIFHGPSSTAPGASAAIGPAGGRSGRRPIPEGRREPLRRRPNLRSPVAPPRFDRRRQRQKRTNGREPVPDNSERSRQSPDKRLRRRQQRFTLRICVAPHRVGHPDRPRLGRRNEA